MTYRPKYRVRIEVIDDEQDEVVFGETSYLREHTADQADQLWYVLRHFERTAKAKHEATYYPDLSDQDHEPSS